MEKFIDCDNFVVGYNLPKVVAYIKKTEKRFEDLSEEELEKLK